MQQVVEGLATQNARIRALYREGYSRSEIRRFMGIRYQHVRNVLVRDGHMETHTSAGLSFLRGEPHSIRARCRVGLRYHYGHYTQYG